jgi:hypothetical protein
VWHGIPLGEVEVPEDIKHPSPRDANSATFHRTHLLAIGSKGMRVS